MDVAEYFEDILDFQVGAFRLSRLLSAVLLALICLLSVKLLLKAADKLFAKLHVDPTLLGMLRAIVKTLLLAIAVLIVLGYLGIPVTSLVALLSVFSLAFSLAVQNALANIAGGIQVLSTRPFHVGDFVEVGDVSGTVEEIRMVYTVISTIDNKRVFMPNSDVAAACITNYTAEGKRRVDFVFSVAYGSEIAAVKAALRRCADMEMVLKEPEPFVALQAYKDSCIDYVLRVWCKTEDYWPTYFAIQENAQGEFDAAGIEMTYPHLNVHLDKDSENRE